MDNTFLLNVTACDRVFFEGRCKQVVISQRIGETTGNKFHYTVAFHRRVRGDFCYGEIGY